jgi:mannose-6-phosphate isomerase
MPGIYTFRGKIKDYDWGGTDFIATFSGENNPGKRPFAEFWMGTHPSGMGEILTGSGQWKPVGDLAGQFSFLLKVLDVKEMLSIQVHPVKADAEKGFNLENAAGIPLDAPERNYKDPNHKPELIVVLDDFWLLYGFKTTGQVRKLLVETPFPVELIRLLDAEGLKGLYGHILEMPQQDVNRMLKTVVEEAADAYKKKRLEKQDQKYWIARAALRFDHGENIDRGIFSFFLMNLLHLKKHEGIYLPPGTPHAYLEGRTVEIMASSDNVLRGGLTNKHIDVKELLKHIKYEPGQINILQGVNIHSHEKNYPVPVTDFSLHIISLKTGENFNWVPGSAEILLLTEGQAKLSENDGSIELGEGSPAALVLAGNAVQLLAIEDAVIFRAGPGL